MMVLCILTVITLLINLLFLRFFFELILNDLIDYSLIGPLVIVKATKSIDALHQNIQYTSTEL